MQHDINPAESPRRLVPELQTPQLTRRRSPLTRMLDLLAVRPGLARVLSDGLLLLVLCAGGLGAVAFYQHAAATRPAPLAGMAELHAQLIEVPVTPGPTDGAAAVPEDPRAAPAPTARTGASARVTVPEDRESAPARPAEAVRPQEVRPITGTAREVVQRLTRAAGLVVPDSALARPTATADVAQALTRAGKPVTTQALAALQAAPDDPAVIQDVTLRLRGVVPPAAAPAAREVGGGPEAVPADAAAPPAAGGAGRAPQVAVRPHAPAGKPSSAPALQVQRTEQGPEPLPGPPRPAASGPSAPGKVLSATLNDPLPVNWLQKMTEQAVTPLTPRN